jgi:hypothetical protein
MFTSRFDLCQSSNFGQQPMNCVSQPDVVAEYRRIANIVADSRLAERGNLLELIQSELGRRT